MNRATIKAGIEVAVAALAIIAITIGLVYAPLTTLAYLIGATVLIIIFSSLTVLWSVRYSYHRSRMKEVTTTAPKIRVMLETDGPKAHRQLARVKRIEREHKDTYTVVIAQ